MLPDEVSTRIFAMSSAKKRILLVDDDEDLLEALVRSHRKHYDLVPACGAEEGLRKLEEEGPFCVIVSDYHMPVMNGVAFLEKAQAIDPEVVRVMLTGHADLNTAIDAVNKGAIFRFLTKPCAPETFRGCLDAALEQHRLRHAERLLLEQTLKGSIEVLADVLALVNPQAFGRATRIRKYVRHIVKTLGVPDRWQFETAALLSQVGCVAIPNDLFDRLASGETLTPEQAGMMDRHPEVAKDLLLKIPRLQTVAQMVQHQGQRGPGRIDSIPPLAELGGRILAVTLEFDELLSVGATPKQAIEAIRQDCSRHDKKILDALSQIQSLAKNTNVILLPLGRMQQSMVLDEDVRTKDGKLIVAKGHELTESSLARLQNYGDLDLLAKSDLRVRVAVSEDAEGSKAA